MVIWKDLYTVHGGFINWTYETLGILSFSNELFAPQEYFNRPNASGAWFPSEEDLLEFNDILALGEYYVPWKEFEHPTYGTIEIGGWTQYSSRVPPPFLIEQMAHRNMAFTLYHARQMPQVDFARREVTRVGEHLWAVTVELRNSRVMGSVSAMAARKEIGARDLLAVEPLAAEGGAPALEVLAGGELTDRLRERVEVVEKNPARLWIELGIGGESARSFRWFVRGAGTVRVRYLSDKAGERVIELAVPPPAEPQQPAAEEL
jgi:hypothetical protein